MPYRIALSPYRQRSFEHFPERHEGLCACHAQRLYLILKQMEKVFIVVGHKFDEDIIAARGKVTFNDFRYGLELFDHFSRLGRFPEIQADVGTGLKAESRRFDMTFRPDYNSVRQEFLNTLVNSGA